jgi:hypothetical protein
MERHTPALLLDRLTCKDLSADTLHRLRHSKSFSGARVHGNLPQPHVLRHALISSQATLRGTTRRRRRDDGFRSSSTALPCTRRLCWHDNVRSDRKVFRGARTAAPASLAIRKCREGLQRCLQCTSTCLIFHGFDEKDGNLMSSRCSLTHGYTRRGCVTLEVIELPQQSCSNVRLELHHARVNAKLVVVPSQPDLDSAEHLHAFRKNDQSASLCLQASALLVAPPG